MHNYTGKAMPSLKMNSKYLMEQLILHFLVIWCWSSAFSCNFPCILQGKLENKTQAQTFLDGWYQSLVLTNCDYCAWSEHTSQKHSPSACFLLTGTSFLNVFLKNCLILRNTTFPYFTYWMLTLTFSDSNF